MSNDTRQNAINLERIRNLQKNDGDRSLQYSVMRTRELDGCIFNTLIPISYLFS